MFLITGSNGQLGLSFKELLSENEAYFCTHENLDISKAIDQKKFPNVTALINCAAYTNVEKAEDEERLAHTVNAQSLSFLADFCNALDIPLIHISTDYVFDGQKKSPYLPTDPTQPLNIYGKTKLEGEKIFLTKVKRGLIIRTSWVYSPYGNNFVKTMLKLGKEKPEISVVSDQWGSPTLAGDLAETILVILKKGIQEKKVYHYTNSGIISWFDFASEIMKLAKLHCRVSPITTAGYKTKAKRPLYSVLDTTSIEEKFGIKKKDWRESLKKMIEKMD